MDVLDRTDLQFPRSLPEFQRLFPDDATCAAYLERSRWGDGFACPHCGMVGDPCRLATRPGVLTCRACRRQTGVTVGTVMARSRTPLSTWFWAACLVASQTKGMSAVQFQRQLGLGPPSASSTSSAQPWCGLIATGSVGGKENMSRSTSVMSEAAAFITRRWWPPPSKAARGSPAPRRTSGRMADSLCGFVESAGMPGSRVVTDDWSACGSLRERGFHHHAIAERGDPEVAEAFLPIVHLVFSNLKNWRGGTHHGVSARHLQAHLNEFTFRFNRRFHPFNAFRSLLGIAGAAEAPTFAEL